MFESNQLLPGSIFDQLANVPIRWHEAFFNKNLQDLIHKICSYIEMRLKNEIKIYPKQPFRIFREIEDPSRVNVLILGQDPYHQSGQAQGIAFAVPNDCKCPPSLKNIFKEIEQEFSDLNKKLIFENDLMNWVRQGVFLLNSILTVEHGKPASHDKVGWEKITDCVLSIIAKDESPKVFILWGKYAQSKLNLLATRKKQHLILMANHPSPLSFNRNPLPFLKCNHFLIANRWLLEHGKIPINWFQLKNNQR